MSILLVRRALEKRLAAMQPPIPTTWDNESFVPPAAGLWQEVRLLPGTPNDAMFGSDVYFEQGIFQVTLCYPQGKGPINAEARAEQLRQWFRRGSSVVEGSVTTTIVGTPSLAPPLPENGAWRLPVSVTWQAQVNVATS